MAQSASRRLAITLVCIVVLAFAVVFAVAVRGVLAERDANAVAVLSTTKVSHILWPEDFQAMGGGTTAAIAPDFDVLVPSGPASTVSIVVSVNGALHQIDLAGASGPKITGIETSGSVLESFALDREGPLLGVAGGYFGLMEQDGAISKSIPVPFEGTRLAPSMHANAVYLFGGAKGNHRLYRFIDDGTLHVLLDSAGPIIAAADGPNSVYAATAGAIMRIRIGTPEVLYHLPENFPGPIRSIAVTEDDVVLFSTDKRVYALLGPNALSIVNNAGGALRVRNGALYVLDTQRRLLFSLSPVGLPLLEGALQRESK